MKMEIVDRKNPLLIRPATVLDVNSYEMKVLYDGWPLIYAFWMEDDNVDIHPVRWAEKTNHPIEFPPSELTFTKYMFLNIFKELVKSEKLIFFIFKKNATVIGSENGH
jgi:hypothetical protein